MSSMKLRNQVKSVALLFVVLLLPSCSRNIDIRFFPTPSRIGYFEFYEESLFKRYQGIPVQCVHVLSLRDGDSDETIWSEQLSDQNRCVSIRRLFVGEALDGYEHEFHPEKLIRGRTYLFSISAGSGVAGSLEFELPRQ